MCLYFALTGSLLRGILRRLFNDLVDWVVFGRRSFCPTDSDNLEKNYEHSPWFQRVDRRRGQQLVEEGGLLITLSVNPQSAVITMANHYNFRFITPLDFTLNSNCADLKAVPSGNGCFLMRPSTKHLMTLSLWYNGRAYNIPIRKRDDGQYSLGTMKPNERVFPSVDELVEHYSVREDLILFSKGVRTGRCRLRIPARSATQEYFRSFHEDESDGGDLYLNLTPADQCVIHM